MPMPTLTDTNHTIKPYKKMLVSVNVVVTSLSPVEKRHNDFTTTLIEAVADLNMLQHTKNLFDSV